MRRTPNNSYCRRKDKVMELEAKPEIQLARDHRLRAEEGPV